MTISTNMDENKENSTRLNKKKIWILLSSLFLLALIIYIFNQVNESRNIQRAENYYKSAEQAISNSNFNEAEKNLKLAIQFDPNSKLLINLLTEVESAQRSLSFISEAKSLIDIGRNQEAFDLLKRAVTPYEEISVEVEKLKVELVPLIESEVNAEVAQLVKNKKYSDAQSTLNSAISLFAGEKEVLQFFMNEHKKVSELKEKQAQIALSKLSKRYDKFQDTTWYKSPTSPNYRNTNAFYIYFGVSDNSKLPLRLVLQYESDDWLFIESATINVDGQNYDVSGDWERDHNSRIWEWIDEKLEDREMIEAIINSKAALIRFEGDQYYSTKSISLTQKNALRDILLAYDALRG